MHCKYVEDKEGGEESQTSSKAVRASATVIQQINIPTIPGGRLVGGVHAAFVIYTGFWQHLDLAILLVKNVYFYVYDRWTMNQFAEQE